MKFPNGWKLALLALAAPAAMLASSEHAAVVITQEGGCLVRDSDGNKIYVGDVHKVITNSKNGNVTLRCQATDVPNTTGQAVHWDTNNTGGGKCGIELNGEMVFTDDWRQTLSADGQATTICHIKKDQ